MSIKLYFLFYFKIDCGCVAGKAEQKKKEDWAKLLGPINRSLCLTDCIADAL